MRSPGSPTMSISPFRGHSVVRFAIHPELIQDNVAYLANTGPCQADLPRSTLRKIKDATLNVGATVVNSDNYSLPLIGHLYTRTKLQLFTRCGQSHRVKSFPVRCNGPRLRSII